MRKWMYCLCTALVLICLSGAALADAPMLEVGSIVKLQNGALYDLDGDGVADDVQLVLTDAYPDDGYDEFNSFVLAVNEQGVSNDMCCYLSDQLYGLRLDEYGGTLLMVFDSGPSDDPCTHFYLYESGLLLSAGSIPSHPADMCVERGIITAPVHGRVLYTWHHDADFALARAMAYDADGQPVTTEPVMYMIPRYVYPMGLIVTLNVDLPLCASMTNPRITATLPKGSQAVLCASDDLQWVYIEDTSGFESGWLKLGGEYGTDCLVSGEYLDAWEVFGGLFRAG